jgi:ADP-heptose:LPS heptosyltransferase
VSSFLELARHLSQSLDLEPVFIGADSDNASALSGSRTILGAGLAEIARLMRDSALFIGNDSGPAHVAAAFGVPEVVLFGPSSLDTWAPWRTPAEAIKADGPLALLPVPRVVAAVERLQARAS